MSLINDALRRAAQTNPPPAPAAEAPPPLEPVELRHPSHGALMFVPAILFVLSWGCFFIVKGLDSREDVAQTPAPAAAGAIPVHARELSPAPPATAEVRQESASPPVIFSEPRVEPEFSPPAPPVVENEPSPPVPPPPAVIVEAPPAQPARPALKLDAIFFGAKKATAVVNSKILFLGDSVAGAKVTAIGRGSVTLDWQGQTVELSLP